MGRDLLNSLTDGHLVVAATGSVPASADSFYTASTTDGTSAVLSSGAYTEGRYDPSVVLSSGAAGAYDSATTGTASRRTDLEIEFGRTYFGCRQSTGLPVY